MSAYSGLYVYVNKDDRQDDLTPNREKSYRMNGLIRAKIIINCPSIVGRNCLAGDRVFLDPNDPVYLLSKEKIVCYDSSTEDEEEDKYEKEIHISAMKENRPPQLDQYYQDHPNRKPKATRKKPCNREVLERENDTASTTNNTETTLTFTTITGGSGFRRKTKNQKNRSRPPSVWDP
jgi:hypothetical protein